MLLETLLSIGLLTSEPPPSLRVGETTEQIIVDEMQEAGATFDEINTMLEIAQCESRMDQMAQNPNSSAAGIFQITRSTFEANSDYPWSERYNERVNIETAVKIWKRRGFQPWQCWKG